MMCRHSLAKKSILTLFTIALFGSTNGVTAETTFETWPTRYTEDVDKTWSIQFSVPMKSSSVISKNVYILDSEGDKVLTRSRLSSDKQTLTVTPIKSFESGESYQLYLTNGIESSEGLAVINPTILPFEVTGVPATATASSEKKTSSTTKPKTSENSSSTDKSNSTKNNTSKSSNSSTSSSSRTESKTNTTTEDKEDSPILDVDFRLTSFLASLTVTTDKTISRVTVEGDDMHYKGQNAFNIGLAGAQRGDKFKVEAYNGSNKKVYSDYHTID